MNIRRSLSILGVAATALTGIALAPGIASASTGGGCGTEFAGATPCISASGNQVKYDMYIDARVPSNCYKITLTIEDENTGKSDTVTVGCSLGHDGPWSVLGLNGHRYYSFTEVFTPGVNFISSPSPVSYFSD